MTENPSSEAWLRTAAGQSRLQGLQSQRSQQPDDRADAAEPRPGEVLRNICLVLGIHVVLIAALLLTLQAFWGD